MKTTIELPDPLMRQVKLRALNEGRKLKDVMADLLNRGLSAPDPAHPSGRGTYLTRDNRSGLPVIRCQHPASAGQRLTPDRVADILLEQEATWQDELVDSNVWLALALSAHDFHDTALDWLDTETSEGDLLFCRSTQQSFLRLLTTSAVFSPFGNPPLTNAEAWEVYQGFLADRRITFVPEPDDLEGPWQRLAVQDSASPKAWMDAYLAAFALTGKYSLVTIDLAFKQYEGLDLLLLTRS